MLLELHVKNLALIERVDVELGEGLNILTGETGAGKSILIGSVNLALGQKAPKDIIRNGAEYAYVELVFSVSQEKQKELEALDVFPDDNGLLIITRKIMPTRSVSKINDETVTAAKLRQVTGLLIDIHGQHEHQSLLHASKHLEILDTFAKSRTRLLKDQVVDAYRQYKALKAELEETAIDLEGRGREMDFLRFEIDEIEAAQLKDGEKESLTEQYRRQANGRKILESLSLAYQAVEMDGIGQALRQVNEVAAYDSQLKGILDQLYDAESILNDIRHAIGVYQEEMAFDEEELLQAEQRLDLIHHMESKYGGTTEQVYKTLEEKKQRLEQLEHYDEYRGKQEERYKQASKRLEELSGKLSKERQKAAADLTGQIRKGLTDLNFLDVSFSMEFRRLDHYTAQGFDEAEFMISTNPGEPGRSLGMVASGGELSRVMLAIKAALADSDAVPTLIFDEIDTGISGRTAQKVSEKLAIISHSHQVICITHLPQIAAMADSHYEIVKSSKGKSTTTRIHLLDGETMVDELARLLGGAEITDAVRQNAREMKKLAEKVKHG
ncbi:MAG: DNA repair protein RecN [Lachnospiraceae bacterium]|nr:DNA repair protein RecN [Lachnospiraceae bacterium]MCI9184293.1 DNA repair protein RecN [Lachnospiraceae bacterium]